MTITFYRHRFPAKTICYWWLAWYSLQREWSESDEYGLRSPPHLLQEQSVPYQTNETPGFLSRVCRHKLPRLKSPGHFCPIQLASVVDIGASKLTIMDITAHWTGSRILMPIEYPGFQGDRGVFDPESRYRD
ncbi:hypothetical protein [Nostoc sp.]|uniref:hypothetical protein n=1 Tax=Nostoc sp. TaxID=1180 RepID=UPI003FA5F874